MGATMRSDPSVIIVNWEKPYETITCLESLHDALGSLSSVILVDNGSQDDSVEILQQRFLEPRFIVLEVNRGFAGGYNAGIREALRGNATYFFLLNNDTLIEPETIPIVREVNADISVPKILYFPEKERIWAAGAYWRNISATVKMRGNGNIDRGQYDEPISLDYSTACALMVRREVFERIGGFNETFQNYFEDYDFCYRARQANFSIQFEPRAYVYHKDATSLDKSPALRWWFIARNTVHFFNNHEPFTMGMLLRNILWVSLRELILLRFDRFIHYLKGYQAGLREIRKQREP